VLATSSAPPAAAGRAPAPNAAAQRPTAGTQRAIPPRFQPPQPAEDEEAVEEEDTEPTNQPVFTFPPPGQPGQQFGGNGGPVINGAPQNIQLNPAPVPNSQGSTPGTSATPGFTGVGAAVPGVIQQPPPTPTSTQRPQPGPMTRPPGGGV
jgi:hypothetical protein